ncbi:MAG TPA: helix-turn-helix transcriptional regulator [Oligoflexus sp.]|uniref:helix-turn-helix domain-containing protein n=1 Tax=Oligoflexus sp. TaxID=1971216 RepID=UPI002D6FA918|nr:helix-turn-helix transcriptional regulator [Oligoflexus sp.]HYX36253.1 helix-turn-helix transcriptional regulator [Oligoflexus sp.]
MKNRIKLNITNLKKSVAQKRIKKADLAVDIGVTRETFSRWLSGKVEYIDEAKLQRLSEILECELSWLSPEIAPTLKKTSASWSASDRIRGDDLIRMGLYSDLWRDVSNLYATTQHPDIVEDGLVNHKLCMAFHSLMDLDFSEHARWSTQPDDQHKNHELFDVMARYNLISGLALLISGQLEDGHRLFKRVIIQAHSEWLISFAYLLSGFCFSLGSSRQEAMNTWNRGLLNFPKSQDDLTIFMQANLRLSLCALNLDKDPAQAQVELQLAGKLFDAIGYRYGRARCLPYEAFLLCLHDDKDAGLEKIQEVSGFLYRLPRLYQLEAILLMGRSHIALGQEEEALHYIEIAYDLAHGVDVLLDLVKHHVSRLAQSDEKIKAQVAQFHKKWAASSARKVL